jgi:hypothetical protein
VLDETVVVVDAVVFAPNFVPEEPELHDDRTNAATPMTRPRPHVGSGLKIGLLQWSTAGSRT